MSSTFFPIQNQTDTFLVSLQIFYFKAPKLFENNINAITAEREKGVWLKLKENKKHTIVKNTYADNFHCVYSASIQVYLVLFCWSVLGVCIK